MNKSNLGKIFNKDSTTSPAVKAVSKIISKAVFAKASDIHIEPRNNKGVIRFRIDGVLIEKHSYEKNIHQNIISHLKYIAKLDTTIHRTPQDGKFEKKIGGKIIDFRVSFIPLVSGEKVVIRILDKETTNFKLEEIGFSENEYKDIYKIINKKSGIILTCGPTGSGKTSLLYSILKKINRPELNIVTVEDPVEYELDGVNQIQVSEGILELPLILKSILRQDPDIIMIGEIRDSDTAEFAIKASLTGHLILSTLHTSNGVSAIFRLLNLGIKSYEISATVNGIIAQRLVRKLCPHCKKKDENFLAKLSSLDIDIDKYKNFTFYTGNGCEYCNGTGYSGRFPLFQLLVFDDDIKELINQKANIQEIKKYCQEKGMKKLIEIGLEKAIMGITSLDEFIFE